MYVQLAVGASSDLNDSCLGEYNKQKNHLNIAHPNKFFQRRKTAKHLF